MRAFVRRAVAVVLAMSLVPSLTGLGACESVPRTGDGTQVVASVNDYPETHGSHAAHHQLGVSSDDQHNAPPEPSDSHAAAPADDCCPLSGAPMGHCAMATGCATVAVPADGAASSEAWALSLTVHSIQPTPPASPPGDLDVPPPRF